MEFSELNTTESIFWASAIIGSTFFVLKFFLNLAGMGDFDSDVEFDGGGEIDGEATESAFKFLSLTSLSAFAGMFGWGGLAAYKEFGWGVASSTLFAAVAGCLMMFVTTWLLKSFKRLESEGATFKKDDLLGQVAKVYQKIPKDSQGKIQITVNGILREIEAISASGKEIESFKNVEIVKWVNSDLVSVKLITGE